jgi:hypothetical protein
MLGRAAASGGRCYRNNAVWKNLAIGVSLDTPEDDPERRIAIINDAGREIGNVPVYSRPSYENPAK